MTDRQQRGVDLVIDISKQLVTICTTVIAAVLAVLLSNRPSTDGSCAVLIACVSGGLAIGCALFLLTDIAAKYMKEPDNSASLRKRLFIGTWAGFYVCVFSAAAYILIITKVV